MKGFAAFWSVLEFVYALIESNRPSKDVNITDSQTYKSSINDFGEGPQLCAAAILLITNQIPLYEVLTIGNRINSHLLTDFNGLKEERVKKFAVVNRFITSSLMCSISTLEPIIHSILKDN